MMIPKAEVCKRFYRAVILILFIPVLLLFNHSDTSLEIATAQDEALTDVEQRLLYTYGEELTFSVRVTSNTELVGARLSVNISGQDAIFSEIVDIAPGATVIASHTITTNTLQMPPVGALNYYWDFLDVTGAQHRTPQQQSRYEDDSVPWSWVAQSADNLTMHFAADTQNIDMSMVTADAVMTQVENLLGYRSTNPINLYIYPELSSLTSSLHKHNRVINDRVTIYAMPDQQSGLLALSQGSTQTDNLEQDLHHVLMHLAIAESTNNSQTVPGWFLEGLALLESTDSSLDSELEDAVANSTLIDLEKLCAEDFIGLLPHERSLAYAQSRSLINYMLDRYGVVKIRELNNAFQQGHDCEQATVQALGISLADLQSRWQNDLYGRVSKEPDEYTSLVGWLIVWGISIGLATLFLAPQPRNLSADNSISSSPNVPDDY